jgi:hypothetical protein
MKQRTMTRIGAGTPAHAESLRDDLEHTFAAGAVAGAIAAFPAILLLMIAGATYREVGAYTPIYSVVGIIDAGPLATALDALSRGESVTFYQHPFSAGIATCLGLGALAGVVFAFAARHERLYDWRALVIGPVHGIFVMALFYLVVLFALGRWLDAEWVTSSLVRLVGWPTLVAAHALYGLVLGLWTMLRPLDAAISVSR